MSDGSGTEPLAVAILAALNASVVIRGLTGRTDGCAIAWGAFDIAEDDLPVICLEDLGSGRSFIENANRIAFLIAAFAEGPTAETVTEQLLNAAERVVTTRMLLDAGLDACLDPTALPFGRDRVPVDEDTRPGLVQRNMLFACLYTPSEPIEVP